MVFFFICKYQLIIESVMLKCIWMHLKQKFTSKVKKIIKMPVWITIPAAFGLLGLLVCFIVFFLEKPVIFSYAKETCTRQLTLFPDVSRVSGDNSGFSVKHKDIFKI